MGFLDGFVDWQQLLESGHGHDGRCLGPEGGQRKRFPVTAPVHEQRHESTHARGVQKIDCAHVQDEVLRRLRAHSLNEFVNRFQAELSSRAIGCYGIVAGLLLFKLKKSG